MSDQPIPQGSFFTDEIAIKDEFGRKSFAERVAQTVMQRPLGEEALAVSIVGEWGSGKSNALYFIKGALTNQACKIATFNPWRFHGEDAMLLHLFQALVQAIDPEARVLTAWQGIAKRLENKTSLLGKVVNMKYPGVGSMLEATAVFLTGWLRPKIEKVREQAREYLLREKWRVVVIVDDVDRLDGADLLTLLRIIKLSAALPNTTFIIAMDEDYVAQIIGAETKSDIKTGAAYLEKLIQVRLTLPAIPHFKQSEYVTDLLNKVLQAHAETISLEDQERFGAVFSAIFLPRIRTPRMAKSLANAVQFEMGLLPLEVNLCDLILLCAARLFYPGLYRAIRCCGEESASSRATTPCLESFIKSECGDAPHPPLRTALIRWLPPFVVLLRGKEVEWAKERRLCSDEYFWRYFTGTILENDVPDEKVRDWIMSGKSGIPNGIDAQLLVYVTGKAARLFLSKLERMLTDTYRVEALGALARNAKELSDEEGTAFQLSNFELTARIAGGAIKHAGNKDAQMTDALEIVQIATDLEWLSIFEQTLPLELLSSNEGTANAEEGLTRVEQAVSERLLTGLDENPPDNPKKLSRCIWSAWNRGDRERLKGIIRRQAEKVPGFALNLIACGCSYRLGVSDPDQRWGWLAETMDSLRNLIVLEELEHVVRDALSGVPPPSKLDADSSDRLELLDPTELGFVFLRAMESRRKAVEMQSEPTSGNTNSLS